jgi:hypothetical protein
VIQHDEDRARGKCVAQQREGDISACKPFAHYPRAYDGSQQERRPEELGPEFLR